MKRDALASQAIAASNINDGVAPAAHGVPAVLPEHVCTIDGNGILRSSDDAWQLYATAGYIGPDNLHVGCNYVVGCEASCGPAPKHTGTFASGLRAVLAGTAQQFVFEYVCKAAT